MEELISKRDLYNDIAELESEALEYTSKLAQSDHIDEWRRMNAILLKRTNFKFRVADAPVILEIPDSGIGDLSDGYHTFNQLYYQRMMLFAALVRVYKQFAWKSRRHEDGELCFNGGWFVVGIDTPQGSYTYHYEDKYWDMFDCEELPIGKHWDGHTEEDVTRLFSLPVMNGAQTEELISKKQAINALDEWGWDNRDDRDAVDVINGLPSVELSTNLAEVGTDCISRQAVLNEFCHSCDGWSCNPNTCCKTEWIRKLPVIQPERKECEEREQGKCPWYAG